MRLHCGRGYMHDMAETETNQLEHVAGAKDQINMYTHKNKGA